MNNTNATERNNVLSDLIVIDENNKVIPLVTELADKETIARINSYREALAELCHNGFMEKNAVYYLARPAISDSKHTAIMFVISAEKIAEVNPELAKEINAYDPGLYDGCVTITTRMTTYRDNYGCIGRSWESGAVQALETYQCGAVATARDKQGVEQAGKLAMMIAEHLVDIEKA